MNDPHQTKDTEKVFRPFPSESRESRNLCLAGPWYRDGEVEIPVETFGRGAIRKHYLHPRLHLHRLVERGTNCMLMHQPLPLQVPCERSPLLLQAPKHLETTFK